MAKKSLVLKVPKAESFEIGCLKLKENYLHFLQKKDLLNVKKKLNLFLTTFGVGLKNFTIMNSKKLTEAINYAKNQKVYLENFLLDGRIPISNNQAENAIRPFAVERRGWLFAYTPKGTEASVIAYSIVETAKANNLNAFQYLAYLFKNLSNINFKDQLKLLAQYLPWSESLPKHCHIEDGNRNEETTSS